MKIKNVVGVHIRVYNPMYFEFLGLDYFKRAMNLFPADTTFLIFSCRIGWVKEHLKDFDKNVIFMEGNDLVRDFYLLNKCKHHIISNSTFSFWAAYLKNDPEQIVIAPDFYTGSIRLTTENGAYPKNWHVLPVQRNEYYQDITKYPSMSIDQG